MRVSAVNNGEGGVKILLWIDNQLRLRELTTASATRRQSLSLAGWERGDFAEFEFTHFTVSDA